MLGLGAIATGAGAAASWLAPHIGMGAAFMGGSMALESLLSDEHAAPKQRGKKLSKSEQERMLGMLMEQTRSRQSRKKTDPLGVAVEEIEGLQQASDQMLQQRMAADYQQQQQAIASLGSYIESVVEDPNDMALRLLG